jgi:hypothetical protein
MLYAVLGVAQAIFTLVMWVICLTALRFILRRDVQGILDGLLCCPGVAKFAPHHDCQHISLADVILRCVVRYCIFFSLLTLLP